LTTRRADRSAARSRRQIAEKYLEVAQIAALEDGVAINVTIGVAVLAGVAAGDAICIDALGERYSGTDHAAAADLLTRVDAEMGKYLRALTHVKSASHYGDNILTETDRLRAIRQATALVLEAARRTT
jgi:hypothetical protein